MARGAIDGPTLSRVNGNGNRGRQTAGTTVLETTVREWLPLLIPLAASLSALFAGLIWWMQRKRLSSRFEMAVIPRNNPKVVAVSIRVTNRSDERLVIEAISVRRPLGILVNNTSGAHLAEMAGQEALQQATPALQTSYRREIETEQSAGWTMLIHHDNEFRSCKTVSITLHILKSFPVIHHKNIRHKKKQLTAILPEAMRDRAG